MPGDRPGHYYPWCCTVRAAPQFCCCCSSTSSCAGNCRHWRGTSLRHRPAQHLSFSTPIRPERRREPARPQCASGPASPAPALPRWSPRRATTSSFSPAPAAHAGNARARCGRWSRVGVGTSRPPSRLARPPSPSPPLLRRPPAARRRGPLQSPLRRAHGRSSCFSSSFPSLLLAFVPATSSMCDTPSRRSRRSSHGRRD